MNMCNECMFDVMGMAEICRGQEMVKRKELGILTKKDRQDERKRVRGLWGKDWTYYEEIRWDQKTTGGGSGGVGLLVRKDIGKVTRESRCCGEGVVSVRIERGGEVLFVIMVYLVPSGSKWYSRNAGIRERVASAVAEFKKEGTVVMIGDLNAHMEDIQPVIDCHGGDEADVDMELVRTSECQMTVSEAGRQCVAWLFGMQMVIMNGMRGEGGERTREGKGERASVLDYVCVNQEDVGRCKHTVVSEVQWIEGDHYCVHSDIQMKPEAEQEMKAVAGKREQKRRARKKKGKTLPGCDRKKGKEEQWKSLEQEGQIVMKKWVQNINHYYRLQADRGEEVNEKLWEDVKNRMQTVVQNSIGFEKEKKAQSEGKERPDSKEMQQLQREQNSIISRKKGRTLKVRERLRLQMILKLKTREVKKMKREEVKKDTERFKEAWLGGSKGDVWEMIKRWESGVKKKTGGDRERMKLKDGTWVEGEDMKKGWRRVFEEVGEKLKKIGQDSEWGKLVSERVRQAEQGISMEQWIDEEKREELEQDQTQLDQKLTWEEFLVAVKKMKNGKAKGIDGIYAELVKHGGEWMQKAVFAVCNFMFDNERVPLDWLRAIKVPVLKKGDGSEYGMYRGVTLLSVVDKLYGMVLEMRVRTFCEKRGLLAEEQFGFRQGKACRDSLLALSEILQNRGKEKVFIGFLDITKAFPSIFQDGLWYKLRRIGIDGKMWRVLKDLYRVSECAVRVNGVADDFYRDEVGLREGCVLSPLLFSLYINEMAEEITRRGDGWMVGGRKISLLMFADDVAIVARSAAGLQRNLDIATGYSHIWNFRFNVGRDKSEVMIVSDEKRVGRGGYVFWLDGKEMGIVHNFKYLGVVFDDRGKVSLFREGLVRKARGALWRVWMIGRGKGWLGADFWLMMWRAYIRPVLEYAGEVFGGQAWPQAEQVQREAGRLILGVTKRTPNEVVRGELGMITLKGRRDIARLSYWWQIVNSKRGGLVRDVYEWSRLKSANNWCRYTKKLLIELGFREEWESEELGKRNAWVSKVSKAVWKKETVKWKEGMQGKKKLDRYRVIKTELQYEQYLDCGGTRAEIASFVEWRGGVAKLRVETGRWVGLQREQRVCEYCNSGEVEEEVHMMTRCSKWRDVWEGLREEWERRGLEGEKAVQWTVRGMKTKGRGGTQMRKVVQAVGRAMALRGGEDRRREKAKKEDKRAKETRKRIVWRMRVKR
jgi:hypothetical protein